MILVNLKAWPYCVTSSIEGIAILEYGNINLSKFHT
jgi:hypothetical protein